MNKLAALMILILTTVCVGACAPQTPAITMVPTVSMPTETPSSQPVDPELPGATAVLTPDAAAAPLSTATLPPFQSETETSQPPAGLPQAVAQFVRLSQLLEMGVQSPDEQPIAQVDGLLVQSPIPFTGGAQVQAGARPYISYVLVTVAEAPDSPSEPQTDNQVLVPWGVLRFGDSAFAPFGWVTYSYGAQSLLGAPRFEGSQALVETDYWSGLGASIPATGEAAQAGAILIRDPLGEIGLYAQGNEIRVGQVIDFIIDTTTGEVTHALLAGGEAFGERTYAVPTDLLDWVTGQSSAAGLDLGRLVAQFPMELFGGAPYFNEIDPSDPLWQEQVEQFWKQVRPAP